MIEQRKISCRKMPKDYFNWDDKRRASITEDEKEQENIEKALEFIDQILRKKCTPEKYAEFLRDGTVICQILSAACPTPLGQAKQLAANPTDRQRIEKLIFDLFDFGVQPSNLFEPDDLLNGRNIPQVTKALLDICQMVYRGQGRSRLRSTGCINRHQFHCLHCNGESFESAGKWRDHMFEFHRDLFANPGILEIVQDQAGASSKPKK